MRLVYFLFGLLLVCWACPAHAGEVDLQVILAADVSRSIDEGEFDLQRKGYAAALSDPRVLQAIQKGANKAISVSFIEWSGTEDQKVVVDWAELRDEEDAGSIASAILSAPRSFMGRTSISAAIDFAMSRFGEAKSRGGRRIIDISGDGTNNSGRPVTEARDDAVAQGVTINGLAIINDRPDMGYSSHTHPPEGLPEYFRQNVVGGADSFLLVVTDFNTFADAMTKKLVKEIEVSGDRVHTRIAAAR